MPALRLSMRQIRELFCLKFGSLLPTSDRQIAAQLGVACSTVAEYLERAHAAGLSWPRPPDLSDAELEERLFARPNIRPGVRRCPEPDWAAMHRELKRPGVTNVMKRAYGRLARGPPADSGDALHLDMIMAA